MEYSHRYNACPTRTVAERLEYHIEVYRQAYNHTLYEYEPPDRQRNVMTASQMSTEMY